MLGAAGWAVGAPCTVGSAELVGSRAENDPSVFITTESLKAPTSAFTFKTLLRHYARQALTYAK